MLRREPIDPRYVNTRDSYPLYVGAGRPSDGGTAKGVISSGDGTWVRAWEVARGCSTARLVKGTLSAPYSRGKRRRGGRAGAYVSLCGSLDLTTSRSAVFFATANRFFGHLTRGPIKTHD